MEVNERCHQYWGNNGRYYAQFKNSNVVDCIFLVGTYGNGCTPDDAIDNYAKEISGKRLAIDSWTSDMKKILVPILIKDHR